MKWNWQRPGWPNFRYDADVLQPLEQQFLLRSGELVGAFRHLNPDDQDSLRIEQGGARHRDAGSAGYGGQGCAA